MYARIGFLLSCFLICGLIGTFATYSIPAPVIDEAHQRAALQAVLTAPDQAVAVAALPGAVDDDTAAIVANGTGPMPVRVAAAERNMEAEEITEAQNEAARLRLLVITLTTLSALFGVALLGPGKQNG